MKRSFLLFVLLCGVVFGLSAQTAADSTVSPRSKAIPFVDQDGDGLRDRGKTEEARQGHGRRMVRFIDVDGDGICDGREQGLGFGGGRGRAASVAAPKHDGNIQRGKR